MRNYSLSALFFSLMFFSMMESAGQQIAPAPYTSGIPINYIRTWDATSPQTNADTLVSKGLKDVRQTTLYVDGLGRALQTVVKKGSLNSGDTARDLVSPVVYDEFSREQYTYLPFVANTTGSNTSISDGLFKKNAFQQDSAFNKSQFADETFYYKQSNFELSPLNRLLKVLPQGNNWVGANRGKENKYCINTVTDSVHVWRVSDVNGNFGTYSTVATYSSGQLYKSIFNDEQGNQTVEFTDKNGHLILKKVQLTALPDTGTGKGYYGWLSTYYIYDSLNRLRCVVQPKGVDLLLSNSWNITALSGNILTEQCFRYEYDQRGRMIKKKTPGAGQVWMAYDARDRLVLSQDSLMRANHQWLYTVYENIFNRQVATGLITDNSNYNNLNYHLVRADTSISYPNIGSYTNDEQTRTFYDDYAWRASYGNPLSSTRNIANDGYLLTASNTIWPYQQAVTQSNQIKGQITGTRIKGSGGLFADKYLYTVNIYDDRGRIIQVQSNNETDSTDIVTTQYSWTGKPLIVIEKHEKGDISPSQKTVVVTKMTYDDLGRNIKTEMRIGSTLVDNNTMSAYHTISEKEYDALSQVKLKKLGRKKDNLGVYTSNPIETLTYDYNIRGWLLGANRNYLKDIGTSHFGFELGFDKRTSIFDNYSANTYNKAQFNGNIGGMIWKSVGDAQKRKYDFDYDATARLLKADFTQRSGSNWNVSAGVDFSVRMGDGIHADSAYDKNGNILAMYQKGVKVNSSSAIDDLKYSYQSNSNKLIEVVDAVNDAESRLGDFHDIENSELPASDDYVYDGNGNLIKDRNKDISSIQYNHLNLPSHIAVDLTANTGSGDVYFRYDALSNKLLKYVTDSISFIPKTTITKYISGFIYEGQSTEGVPTASSEVLQFFNQEEGRVRFNPGNPEESIPASFAFDYFIKDHLGNVRMVLTEDQRSDHYPGASMETAQESLESLFYSNLDETRVDIPFKYPFDRSEHQTIPNEKVAWTRGDSSRIGPGILLKVMSGDKFNWQASSWYYNQTKFAGRIAEPAAPNSPLTDIISAINNSLPATSHGNISANDISLTGGVSTTDIQQFLTSQTGIDTTRPKAFINWILMDEQLHFVPEGSGFEQVPWEGEFGIWSLEPHVYLHTGTDLSIPKNGYLYLYVSNETPNIDVYFDDLEITHIRGSLLEESHYYPFGIAMHGISSKALTFGDPENKKNKFQNQELNDDLGINYYEFKYRNHDPQIGRFIQVDPLADQYPHNSSYAFSENRVTSSVEIEGLEAKDLYRELEPIRQYREQYGLPEPQTIGERILEGNLVVLATVTTFALGEIIPGMGLFSGAAKKNEANIQKAERIRKAEERAAKLSERQRPGQDMTKAGKDAVKELNEAKNDKMICENCGKEVQPAKQHKAGEKPPENEAHVDHIDPKSNGGSGTPNNGQVLCRGCNLEKSNKTPTQPDNSKFWTSPIGYR